VYTKRAVGEFRGKVCDKIGAQERHFQRHLKNSIELKISIGDGPGIKQRANEKVIEKMPPNGIFYFEILERRPHCLQ